MQNLTKLSKIILALTTLFFTVWLGSYISRQVVIYQFFDPENLSLKLIYSINNLSEVLFTIFPLIVLNIVSYTAFLLSLLVFLFQSKISLKKEGWLFISVLVVLICAPFEIFLILKDYKIANAIYSQNFDPLAIVNLIRDRMTILSSFSLIEIISFIGIIFLFVIQPMKKY